MHLLLIHGGRGGVSSGSWRRDLPLLCAAGFQGGQRRICLPSWKKIIVKPKTTDVTILSVYLFWENSVHLKPWNIALNISETELIPKSKARSALT